MALHEAVQGVRVPVPRGLAIQKPNFKFPVYHVRMAGNRNGSGKIGCGDSGGESGGENEAHWNSPQVRSPQFQNRNDFAAVVQPFLVDTKFPTVETADGVRTDIRYLSHDCFHPSQLGHAKGRSRTARGACALSPTSSRPSSRERPLEQHPRAGGEEVDQLGRGVHETQVPHGGAAVHPRQVIPADRLLTPRRRLKICPQRYE